MQVAHDLEAHRPALTGHCYRMLGSAVDADDAVQETMIRAWRALDGFGGRASLKTWLYRIATNVCLDTLEHRSRRERPIDCGAPGSIEAPLVERPRSHWLEPIADSAALPPGDPAERAILRQSIRLAFVAALQYLPPKQRAVLLLADVLGWSASEIATLVESSVASVNSALQRARVSLAARGEPAPDAELSSEQVELLDRYLTAFERYDVDALTGLLHRDATLSMPPYALWLRGSLTIRDWLRGPGNGCRGSRLIPVSANGLPAFGQYRAGSAGKPHQPWALIVLELDTTKIVRWNSFLDTERLFPRFGLPPSLV